MSLQASLKAGNLAEYDLDDLLNSELAGGQREESRLSGKAMPVRTSVYTYFSPFTLLDDLPSQSQGPPFPGLTSNFSDSLCAASATPRLDAYFSPAKGVRELNLNEVPKSPQACGEPAPPALTELNELFAAHRLSVEGDVDSEEDDDDDDEETEKDVVKGVEPDWHYFHAKTLGDTSDTDDDRWAGIRSSSLPIADSVQDADPERTSMPILIPKHRPRRARSAETHDAWLARMKYQDEVDATPEEYNEVKGVSPDGDLFSPFMEDFED